MLVEGGSVVRGIPVSAGKDLETLVARTDLERFLKQFQGGFDWEVGRRLRRQSVVVRFGDDEVGRPRRANAVSAVVFDDASDEYFQFGAAHRADRFSDSREVGGDTRLGVQAKNVAIPGDAEERDFLDT